MRIESNVRGIRTTGDSSSSLRIEDSTVKSNLHEGVYVQARSDVALVRSVFTDNNYGVWSENLLKLRINGCVFANNIYGFEAGGVLSDVRIHDTNFSDVERGLALSLSYQREELSNITVQNCTFSGQKHSYYYNRAALYVYVSNTAYRIIHIVDCLFHDNVRGILMHGNGNSARLVLLGNTFSENRGNLITVSGFRGNGGLTMNNCTFVANAGDHVVRLNEEGTHSIFNNNTFINNTATTTLSFQNTKPGQMNCTQNAFSNPQAKFELLIETEWADGYKINVSYNWWGSINTTLIRSRIRDFFLDMSRAEALLSPIYENPTLDSSKTLNISSDFDIEGEKHGGRLTEDTVLIPDNHTTLGYTVHVPRGKKLTIRTNGTLQFAQGTGIFVQGKTIHMRTYVHVHVHVHVHACVRVSCIHIHKCTPCQMTEELT